MKSLISVKRLTVRVWGRRRHQVGRLRLDVALVIHQPNNDPSRQSSTDPHSPRLLLVPNPRDMRQRPF